MISFIIGIILGIIYFGGLYFTVQMIDKVKHPSLIMTLSFIVRMGILVAVFYYISKDGYQDMLFALIGMMLVRFLMTFKLKNQVTDSMKKR